MTHTNDQTDADFFAGIDKQLRLLAEQRTLRQTAISCLSIGATTLAEAALETALDLGLYPADGPTTNEQALRLIARGEIEAATELLKEAVVPRTMQ